MPDLSKTRARPSASSRSRGGSAADTTNLNPTVRSQDVARDVSGAGAARQALGDGLVDLGQSLRSFVAGARQSEVNEHRQAMHDIEKRNIERSRIAQTTALSKPNELREALETGDFGALGLDQTITHSDAFFETAHQELSIQSANEQAASQGFLAGVSGSEAPDDFVDTWIAAQTKGMPPVAAQAFATQFQSNTAKAVGQRKAVMAQDAARQQTAVVMKNFEQSPPTTLEELDGYIGAVRNSASIMGPQEEMNAQAALEQHLLKKAIMDGEPWAIQLVDATEDKRNDGLSIRDRHSEAAKAIEQDAIKAVGDIKTQAEASSLQNIQKQIVKGDLTTAGEALVTHMNEHGEESDEYLRLLSQFKTAWKEQNTGIALMAGIVGEQYSSIKGADLRKHDFQIHSNWDQNMAQHGVPEEEWLPRQVSLLEMHEPSGDAKQMFAQKLLEGDERTIALLDGMGDMAKKTLPESYGTLWEALQTNPDSGEAIRQWREAQQNPRGFTKSNALEEVHGINTTTGKNEIADETLEMALALSPAAGLDSTFGINTPFGADDLDVSDENEVSRALRPQMKSVLRQVIVDHPKMTLAEQQDIAAKRMKDQIAVEYRGGKPRAVFAPINLRGAVGGVGTKISNPDATYMGEADSYLEKNIGKLSGGIRVGPRGPRGRVATPRSTMASPSTPGENLEFTGDIEVDELTGQNMGVVPLFETGEGGKVPLTFDSTGAQFLPPEMANSPMFKGWGEPTNAQDLIDPNAPEGWVPRVPPAHGTMVGDRLMWATVGGTSTLRYIGEDVESATARRLDANQKPKVMSGQGTTGHDPRGLTRLRRAAAKKQVSDAAQDKRLDNKARNSLVLSEPSDDEEAWSLISKAHADTNARGEYLLDMVGSARGLEYSQKYDKFLAVNEGPSTSYVYDDKAGVKRIKPGQKILGVRTIGRGYNMERGDWNEMSARLGLNKDQASAVFKGERELTDGQLNRLNAILSQEAARAVYKRYKDLGPQPEHFYLARMSLWHHGVQDTTEMDKALRAGDWNLVAEEILFRSLGGATKRTERGFKARRAREARLMLGDRINGLRADLKEILLRVDPWKGMSTHGDY